MRLRFAIPLLLLWSACSSGPEPMDPELQKRIAFEGVKAVPERELRGIVESDAARYAENPRPAPLDDAAFRVAHRYRREGFAQMRVSWRVEGGRVFFEIHEGPQVFVGRAHFRGNAEVDEETLKRMVGGGFLGEDPPYTPNLVAAAESGILEAYRSKGFLDAAVKMQEAAAPDRKSRVHLTFVITEGRPYLIGPLRGLPPDPEVLEAVMRTFRGSERPDPEGDRKYPYTPATKGDMENAISEHYREHGYPFATARVVPQLNEETREVTLEVSVQTGDQVRLGSIDVRGRFWSRRGFVRSRSGLDAGDTYRASEFRRAEERLMDTGVFKSVRVGLAQEGPPPERPVEIDIEEREIGEASVRGGYGSFEGPRVGADLVGLHLLGGAESVRVSGTVSKVGYRAESAVIFPYFAATDLKLEGVGYFEDREFPSFHAVSRGGVFALSYPLSNSLALTAGFQRATIKTDNVEPGVPPGDLEDFDYVAPFIGPVLDLRDSAVLPTRGVWLDGAVAWSPDLSLSDVAFLSARGRLSYWMPLPKDLVFAASLQAGVIKPLGSTDLIPISLRHFAGGTSSVRGFKFEAIGPQGGGDSTGGEVFAALQTEVRFPIWSDFYGAVFSDRGGVWFDHRDVDLDDLRYSVGLGVRYYTGAGPLVADVGWNPRREEGERAVELHLSVGFPF